ncbi:MAG: glycoside hydrolase family 20 zincin-like fold domain-containing protein, partial [Kiritimatiellae bacterium]|nr:glycoside hydrolase family 20 zincin-like fold domain-containing protein [Kiritimatiellia bacterium]
MKRGRFLVTLCVAGTVVSLAIPTWCSSSDPTLQTQCIAVLPTPKQVQLRAGRVQLVRSGSTGQGGCCILAGRKAGFAAKLLAERLGVPVTDTLASGSLAVKLSLDAKASFAAKLGRDARSEAYCLEVNSKGVEIVAVESEGLLRAAATLLQLLQVEKDAVFVPELTITDWPNFRYRCASDWLINVECNRWSYDWGDGRQAYLARIKRKLDLCFAYKINQVWFDGFGWDTQRCEGYAELMRECTGYARQRGIKLTFAGYGGGYGTSYQKSEIYRTGYFGRTLINRRPYPDGAEYLCRGMKGIEESRRYGTCLSNKALQQEKLDEMKRFVAAVEPGFMYIHDIDSGTYAASQNSWLLRCDECRKRWPSDEVTDPRGQAGAMADWFRQIRRTLDSVKTRSGYRAARDLTLIFISPLYTEYYEKGPPDLWQRETDYFCQMSRSLGPAAGVAFGLREQFYGPGSCKK